MSSLPPSFPPPGQYPPGPYQPYPQAMPPPYPQPKSNTGVIITVVVVVVVVFGGALLISILLPALNAARSAANAVKSSANLRQITMAMMLYSTQQREFPPNLEAVTPYMANMQDFRHPENSAASPASNRVTLDGDYVYVYTGYRRGTRGLRESDIPDRARFIILHERPNYASRGQISVGFADGHVERIPAANLQSLLASQQPPPPK